MNTLCRRLYQSVEAVREPGSWVAGLEYLVIGAECGVAKPGQFMIVWRPSTERLWLESGVHWIAEAEEFLRAVWMDTGAEGR